MYPFLSNAYYSDTDSVFLDYPLNKDFIGSDIGQFKLEYGGLIKKAIFPGSKLYLLDTNYGIISKSKGYSGKLSLSDYITLYKADVIRVTDTRWHKDIMNKTVKVVEDQEMVITGEYNKRNKIYSKSR
jgi:DNA polymerase elongation subunit (family B)